MNIEKKSSEFDKLVEFYRLKGNEFNMKTTKKKSKVEYEAEICRLNEENNWLIDQVKQYERLYNLLEELEKSRVDSHECIRKQLEYLEDKLERKGQGIPFKTPPELMFGDVSKAIKEPGYIEKLIKVRCN